MQELYPDLYSQLNEAADLDLAIRNNMEALGYGE